MYQDLNIKEELLVLQYILELIPDWTFDNDIEKLINELRTLTYQKMYGNFKFKNKDINNYKLFIRYYYEK